MTRTPSKFNDSGIKMYRLLTLLFQGDPTFKDIIEIFMDGEEKPSANNANVCLCKYLNSLKVFGIRVEKISDRYHAYNLPYSYGFTKAELCALQQLKSCSDIILSQKTKANFDSFIAALELRFDDRTQRMALELNSDEKFDFSFFFTNMKEKIELCEKFISDSLNLDIIYTVSNGEEKKIYGKPIEINYGKRYAALQIYSMKEARLFNIPIIGIRSVIQSPQKSAANVVDTAPVVYKLSGRLAQNYKLRENEYSRGLDPFDGRLIVVNKNEDIETLLHRLMRYGTSCEIRTPKAVRDEMTQLIKKTIENYS